MLTDAAPRGAGMQRNRQRGNDINISNAAAGGGRDTDEPARIRMICGDCCLPGCLVRARVKLAFAEGTGEEVAAASGEFVVVECSSPECPMGGQLHKECFDKLEEKGLAAITTGKATPAEKRKWMWKSGRRGSFDTVRKLCSCACNRGTFVPLETSPGCVVLRCGGGEQTSREAEGGIAAEETDGAMSLAEKRKQEIEAKLARKRELEQLKERVQREERAREAGAAGPHEKLPLGEGRHTAGARPKGSEACTRPLPSRAQVAEATKRNERLRQRKQEERRQAEASKAGAVG